MTSVQLLESDLTEIYTLSQGNFEKLKGKKLFITGGTGFFGKWLIESIAYANKKLSHPIEVTSTSRNPDAFYKRYPYFKTIQNLNLLKGDLCQSSPIIEECDYIIHAAADVRVNLTESEKTSYLANEEAILESVKKMAKEHSVSRILYISSGAVYGKLNANDPLPCEDEKTSHAGLAYAQAKINGEKNLKSFCESESISYNISRSFAFIGPYLPLDSTYAAGNFFSDSIKKKTITIKGDGSPLRSYLYMTDLTHALLTLLTHHETNQIFNIGSDTIISILKLAENISLLYPNTQVKVIQAKKLMEPAPCYVPNINKGKDILKWAPTVSLDDALKRFKLWLSEN